MNIRLIYKIMGSLLFFEAMFMLLCLGVALWYGEDDVFSFMLSILITLTSGFVLRFLGREADNSMSRRDSFLVVTLAWTMFSLYGTLPFLVGGHVLSFTDAFFESMSGFTTTGATIFDDVECLPHGLLFWRSISQWIGGLGIVFFTIAILPSVSGGSVKVFSAEATGPIKSKLHPRLSSTAQSIWVIFLVLSLACCGAYKLLGMDWYDAASYSMTTLATGGFAPHNDSLLHFANPTLEYVSTGFCFLSGINFILLYRMVMKGKFRDLVTNTELRFYIGSIVVFTAVIAVTLFCSCGYGYEKSLRSALYQVVSLVSTTGVFNDDIAAWPHFTWLLLALCMFMGGCAGSTAGGFKAVRCVMLLKNARNEFRQMLHPRAVLPLRINDSNVSTQRRVTLLSFLTIYAILCCVCMIVMSIAGLDSTNALTVTISTLSNIGPSLTTEVGPSMSWAALPDYAKWTCSALMLMGRLEIFSVLVIFTPGFWREH